MFYCENCSGNHFLPCLNRHLYYRGQLCTCKCNWNETLKSIPENSFTDFVDYIPIQVFVTCTHGFCDILASKFRNNFSVGRYKGASIIHKELSFDGEGTILTFDVAKDKFDSIFNMIIEEPCVKRAKLFQILK